MFRDKSRKNESDINDRQLHTHTEMTPIGKTKGGPSRAWAPLPQDPTRMVPPSCLLQPRRPARAVGPMKPQIGELFSSTQAQQSGDARMR
jgi:hypothetical protein